MKTTIRIQLSLMMFLQYFIWGAWWVTLGTYMSTLGFADIIGRTYATQGLAAIIAPLFLGVIVDRYFSAQKVLGVLHILGALLLLYLTTVTDSKSIFYIITLAYMMTFIPTIAISNTIAFGAMEDSVKQFPGVRVFGTFGWIAAGLILSFVVAKIVMASGVQLTIEQTSWPIKLAALGAGLLGVYSFFLPDTPPKEQSTGRLGFAELLGLDSLKYVKSNAFWVFMVASLLLCVPLTFYYSYTNAFLVEKGAPNAVALQSLGQMSEIIFMLLLPLFILRFGFKLVFLIGMLCWALRYVLFAFGYEGAEIILPMAIAGIVIHGLCHDLFFVAGQIYVDKAMPSEARGRAQSFLTLVTLGFGTLIGGELANLLVNANTVDGLADWKTIWLIPGAMAAGVAVIFVFTFHEKNANK